MEIDIPSLDESSLATMKTWLAQMLDFQATLVDAVANILDNNQAADSVVHQLRELFSFGQNTEHEKLVVEETPEGFSVTNETGVGTSFVLDNGQWIVHGSAQAKAIQSSARQLLRGVWWGNPDMCHHIFHDRCFFINVDQEPLKQDRLFLE